MSSGLLSLRKLQLRAIFDRARPMTRASIIRAWAHDVVRLHEQIYRAEHHDELSRLALVGEGLNDLAAGAEEARTGFLTCARCTKPPCGFRTRESAAIFQLLGVCQACQDGKHDRQPSS